MRLSLQDWWRYAALASAAVAGGCSGDRLSAPITAAAPATMSRLRTANVTRSLTPQQAMRVIAARDARFAPLALLADPNHSLVGLPPEAFQQAAPARGSQAHGAQTDVAIAGDPETKVGSSGFPVGRD